MAFFVKFWGTRGSIPTPGYLTQKYGGNTSCVELNIDSQLLILDAGSGIRELGLDLEQRGLGAITGHLFLSHAHWDHIQGFPFFQPAYSNSNTFYVYGHSQGDSKFYRLLSGQMQTDYFPVRFSELKANILARDLESLQNQIEGIVVRSLKQVHQGTSFAYSFEKDGCKVVYASDCELDQLIENREASLTDPHQPRIVPPAIVDFVREADLLIGDGQYTDEEYGQKIGWGHTRATTLVDLAQQANIKQVAVFHHDPLQSDEEVSKKIAMCNQRAARLAPNLIIFAAREGVTLRID